MSIKKLPNYDVFISYRRASGGWAYARLIAELLKNVGFSVFIDVDVLNKDAFGADFEKVITEAIKKSKCVIFVLTENALDRCVSDNTDVLKKEILLALEYNKQPIPVTDSTLTIPQKLDPRIKHIFDWQGAKIDEQYFKYFSSRLINYLCKITGKKPIIDDETKNKYVGLLSVGKENNLLIDYGASTINKNICLRESEVYKRNAKKLFNSKDNDVELNIMPIKE